MKVSIAGIVLLDASFRHNVEPLSREVTTVYPQTEVPMELGLMKGEVPNTYAVVLRVGIQSPKDLYAMSVGYAVLLSIDPEGVEPPSDFDNRLMVTGASIAMPYCREVVSNLSSRGRFGTVWISPTNFSQFFPQNQTTEATVAAE